MFAGRCAALCPPAASLGRSSSSLGRLQSVRYLFGLLDIFVCGAPEEQAIGYFSDRHRYAELCSHAEDAVFHGGGAGALRDRHLDGLRGPRWDPRLQFIIELWVYARAAAHPSSYFQGNVFKLDGR
jgi:hypothetical protein